MVYNLLNLLVYGSMQNPIFEDCCPVFYNSLASKRLKEFVRGPMCGYIVASVLILNFVAVIIETTV